MLPLRNLNLIKNVLTDEQIGPVSKTLKENTNIQQIFMSHNRMSVAAMQTLADGLKDNKVLTDFFFTHNDLQAGGEGGLSVLKSLANKKDLRSLALNSCNINGEYLQELENSIAGNTELKELYLFANRIGPDGSKQISAMIKNKAKLTSLGLSNNKLNDTGCIELAQNGLVGKRFLVKLSFENNGMGNTALEAVSASLMDCQSIQELYLYNNELDDDPIENFCELLSKQ